LALLELRSIIDSLWCGLFSSVGELFMGHPEAPCSVMQQVMVQSIVMAHCFEAQQDWPSRLEPVKAV
jgi:hypothetical protein